MSETFVLLGPFSDKIQERINLPASKEFGNEQGYTFNNATSIIVQCLI